MTAHAYTLTLLSISRAVAGAGMGVSAAAAQAAAAASPQPERLFGIYFAVSTALGALLLLGLPQLIAIHGYAAGYSLLGAVSLIATPLVAWLPPPPALVNSTIEQTRTSEAPRRARGILALTALALVSASDYGTWTFIERIGAGAGLGPEAIGETLAIGTLVASGASALAAWVGTRFGRLRPLVASFCCMVVAVIGFSSAASPAIYIAMLMVWCASVFIAYSYLMGALAVADATGRLSATAAGARSIGAAIGPTAAGVVVAGLGYRSAGLMVGCWCALALVLSLSFILHLSRTERARQLNPT
jgi:predicted MFS family arabinose efflux permease